MVLLLLLICNFSIFWTTQLLLLYKKKIMFSLTHTLLIKGARLSLVAGLKVAMKLKTDRTAEVLRADLHAIAARALVEASARIQQVVATESGTCRILGESDQRTGSPTLACGEGIIALPLVALPLLASFVLRRSDNFLLCLICH